jgi:serine/alanine adding enzyme
MHLLINKQISTDRWISLLKGNTYSSPFQTPAFFDLFNSVPGLSADVFAVEENSEIISLCVITSQKEPGFKNYFSRRAIIYGGPVLRDGATAGLKYLLSQISIAFKKKSIYTEIRNLHDYGVFRKVFDSDGWQYTAYQNFIVDCSDFDRLFHNLGSNRKRQIKKALSSGVEIKEAESLKEVNEYYTILTRLYYEKIKKPLFPKIFFEEFFSRNLGKFFLVMYKGQIIGGLMCPILKDKCIYELYVCGLDEDYREQYPSVMATWAALEYANKNGIAEFDFMGAGKKELDYGVREFKARFGGKLIEYGRYIKINDNFLYKIGVFALNLMQKRTK